MYYLVLKYKKQKNWKSESEYSMFYEIFFFFSLDIGCSEKSEKWSKVNLSTQLRIIYN